MGDVYAPLLRVITVERSKTCGSGTHSGFIHTHYFPIQDHSSTIIRVAIYNEAGVLVNFLSGKVVIAFHFRAIVKGRDGLSG